MVRCDRPGPRPWVFFVQDAVWRGTPPCKTLDLDPGLKILDPKPYTKTPGRPPESAGHAPVTRQAGFGQSPCLTCLPHEQIPKSNNPYPMSQWHPGARVRHDAFGEGTVLESSPAFIKVYFDDLDKSKQLPRSGESAPEGLELLEAGQAPEGYQPEEIEDLVWRVMERYIGGAEKVALGERWNGGTLVLKPGDSSLAPKELPMETFFHKIVMLRDRLRVLEQQINGHAKLNEEEKVHLQQYITRSYGSLTSFNTLFKFKDDHFKGAGKGS